MPYAHWQEDSTYAYLEWNDPTKVTIEDERCGGVDQGCTFMSSTTDGLQLTITDTTGGFLTGEFSGLFFLTGTGHSFFKDESQYVDVSEGAFRIKFRVSDEE